jgi:hypothetical protein
MIEIVQQIILVILFILNIARWKHPLNHSPLIQLSAEAGLNIRVFNITVTHRNPINIRKVVNPTSVLSGELGYGLTGF